MPRLHDRLKVISFKVLLLCFLCVAQGIHSVQAESVPAYIKYPDLWDSRPGMQPILEDEERSSPPPSPLASPPASRSPNIDVSPAPIPSRKVVKPIAEEKSAAPSLNYHSVIFPPKPLTKPYVPAAKTATVEIEAPIATPQETVKSSPAINTPSEPATQAVNKDTPFIVLFRAGSSDLDPLERDKITNEFLESVFEDAQRKVRILAFSGKVQGHSAGAKRMALSRGLMLREFLIARGLNSGRIDLHVLGFVDGDTRPNRAELFIQ